MMATTTIPSFTWEGTATLESLDRLEEWLTMLKEELPLLLIAVREARKEGDDA